MLRSSFYWFTACPSMTSYLQRSKSRSWFYEPQSCFPFDFTGAFEGIKKAAEKVPGYSGPKHVLWPQIPAASLLITTLNHNRFSNILCRVLLLTSLYSEQSLLDTTLCFLLFNWDLILNMALLFILWFPWKSPVRNCQKPLEISNNLHPPHPLYPIFYEPL